MAIAGGLTVNDLALMEIDENPIIAGLPATVGSIAMLDSGRGVFYKNNTGDRDWVILGAGAFANYAAFSDDFVNSTSAGLLGWTQVVSGAGAASAASNVGINTTDYAFGVVSLATGTTAAGRATLNLGLDQLLLSTMALLVIDFRINIGTLLSDATNRYTIRFGLFDQSGAGDAIDGVYFEYDGLQSVNWRIATASNSTRTKANTSVTVAVNNFMRFRMIIQPGVPTVKFLIDGVDVGDIATNLPLAAGRNTGFAMKIEKSVGTTSRIFYCDYFRYFADFGVNRL